MFYALSIFLYKIGIGLAASWNPKARAWVDGRKDWKTRYIALLAKSSGRKKLWIHCASLGEFEQGRPVIEAVRKNHPDVFIVLSFFSPSGYEIRKNYPGADVVIYLPSDTLSNAKAFLDIIQPDLVIFVKYEFWLNYLEEMYSRKIPVLMISTIFRPGQIFFRWYGKRWNDVLKKISHFFVQDEGSAALLEQAGVKHYTISGDTRFDRVISIRDQFTPVEGIADFCGSSKIVVAGSTWPEDEEIWDHFSNVHPEIKFIIAPHEIYEGHLRSIEKLFLKTIRYSTYLEKGSSEGAHVLIIDNIGMLSRLYHYAHISYVGGGFGAGIHNILEAAAHGKPVIFGPEYDKFREAVEILDLHAGFTVSSALELEAVATKLLEDEEMRSKAGELALHYVESRSGATGRIMDHLKKISF